MEDNKKKKKRQTSREFGFEFEKKLASLQSGHSDSCPDSRSGYNRIACLIKRKFLKPSECITLNQQHKLTTNGAQDIKREEDQGKDG
jgi:hypothetical protein